jgi:tRNA threonylcarbamoyladenosine biosynthesis protein TsaE
MKTGWKGNETVNPEETIQLGEDLSSYLEQGDVLALVGELASGKTTFIQGMLRGLKYSKPVTSPTFTLINEYDAIHPVIHIDCYREENLNRWIKVGFHDYINEENIVIIEWAEKIFSFLPDDHIQIVFKHRGQDKREIILLN